MLKRFKSVIWTYLEKAADSDLIVISIPITKTPGLIREIVTYIQKKGSRYVRLIEISSVKNEIGSSGLFDDSLWRKGQV